MDQKVYFRVKYDFTIIIYNYIALHIGARIIHYFEVTTGYDGICCIKASHPFKCLKGIPNNNKKYVGMCEKRTKLYLADILIEPIMQLKHHLTLTNNTR